ncbi:Bug family tripartite tricarboxylate transporter substrate binding protein [Verticiella sediminum]|nr:tripartite tricarboxylate transporter substrate binding protein [Verticiella sediminum]
MPSKSAMAIPVFVALFGMAAAGAAPLSGQPITLIVPHATGTGVDVVARAFAPHLEKALGTSVVIENRVGANGSIGSVFVARAKPDGHTLLMNASPPFVTYPMTQDKPLYDAEQDFSPIAMVGSTPMVLVVSASSGIDGMEAFVQHAKSHPESANYASPGPGSAGHLAMEQLAGVAGIDIEHVLYKTTSQSLTDVAAGHILSAFVSIVSAAPLLDSGRLRAIAVGSAERLPAYPQVPTLKEAIGLPNFEAAVWYGFLGPKGMSEETVQAVYRGVAQAYDLPEAQAIMRQQSVSAELQSPEAFKERLQADAADARKVLDGIVPQ